ncbi:MAG: DNA repair protein [Planctomycetes bacterium]|nr:DNA repair protein [Planctomycetota bacterium]
MREVIRRIHDRLLEAYGPQGWWPVRARRGSGPTRHGSGYHPGTFFFRDAPRVEEIAIGAVLAQATAWTNAARAVDALARRGVLRLARIASMPLGNLAEMIRPSGYFRQKARRLRGLARDLSRDGAWRREGTEALRARLLSLWGIGPETADSILLYALGRPVFVVDAYTRRILSRVGICGEGASYGEIQGIFHASLESDPALFNEYHALIVELGKRHCRRAPACVGCPLAADPVLCARGGGLSPPSGRRRGSCPGCRGRSSRRTSS